MSAFDPAPASGPLISPVSGKGLKFFSGTATTDSSGKWAIDMTSAGFSAVPMVVSIPIAPDNTVANAYQSSQTAATKTSVGGVVAKPNTQTISALGATVTPLVAVGAGVPVNVIAFGQ